MISREQIMAERRMLTAFFARPAPRLISPKCPAPKFCKTVFMGGACPACAGLSAEHVGFPKFLSAGCSRRSEASARARSSLDFASANAGAFSDPTAGAPVP